jgi:hypothetical protein
MKRCLHHRPHSCGRKDALQALPQVHGDVRAERLLTKVCARIRIQPNAGVLKPQGR